eukprot:332220-Heterocapsa_arctica.AAC.2
MRPDAVTERDLDLEDMHLEGQNEAMREQIARPMIIEADNETELRYVRQWPDIAIEGEPIRVRPRMTEADDEKAVRYVKQWPAKLILVMLLLVGSAVI